MSPRRKIEKKNSDRKKPLGNIGRDNAKFFLQVLSAKLVCIISTEHILGEIIQTKPNYQQ